MSEAPENQMAEMLGRVMENPDLLQKIAGIASSGGGDLYAKLPKVMSLLENDGVAESKKPEDGHPAAPAFTDPAAAANRKKLLAALRPYLSKPRREAVDQLLRVSELSELIGKLPGNLTSGEAENREEP